MEAAHRAIEKFEEADRLYTDTLAELEEEDPEGFQELYRCLEERNTAVTVARAAVRKAKTKVGKFRVVVNRGVEFDVDAFIEMAKKLGIYEELVDAGAVKTTINQTTLKKNVTEDQLQRLKEGCGKVIEKSVSVYGPKELGTLK